MAANFSDNLEITDSGEILFKDLDEEEEGSPPSIRVNQDGEPVFEDVGLKLNENGEPVFEDAEKPEAYAGEATYKGMGGLVPSMARGAVEGITTEMPAQIGKGLRWAGGLMKEKKPYDRTFVEKAVDFPKEMMGEALSAIGGGMQKFFERKATEWWGPEKERTPKGDVERWVYQGSKMLGPSIIPGYGTTKALQVVGGVGTLVKASKAAHLAGDTVKATELMAQANKVAKDAVTLASAVVAGEFGAAQAQDTTDLGNQVAAALELQGKMEEAKAVRAKTKYLSLATGTIEALGEFLGTKYLAKALRLDEAEVVKKGLKECTKRLLKTLGVESITEVGQQAGELGVERAGGLRGEDLDILKESLDVIPPTVFMTLITLGIGGAKAKISGTGRPALDEEHYKVFKELESNPLITKVELDQYVAASLHEQSTKVQETQQPTATRGDLFGSFRDPTQEAVDKTEENIKQGRGVSITPMPDLTGVPAEQKDRQDAIRKSEEEAERDRETGLKKDLPQFSTGQRFSSGLGLRAKQTVEAQGAKEQEANRAAVRYAQEVNAAQAQARAEEAARAKAQAEADRAARAQAEAQARDQEWTRYTEAIKTSAGLFDEGDKVLTPFEMGGTSEQKQTIKPIRELHKALATEIDNVDKLKAIRYEVTNKIELAAQLEPKLGPLVNRLLHKADNKITALNLDKAREERAKEREKAAKAKAGGKEGAKKPAPAPEKVQAVTSLPETGRAMALPAKEAQGPFDRSTTDMPMYDQLLREGKEAKIVEMTPDRYLAWQAEVKGTTRAREDQLVDQNLAYQYALMMRAGDKFPMPMIDLVEKTQEGKHRAHAAKILGLKTIPVVVRGKNLPGVMVGTPKPEIVEPGPSVKPSLKGFDFQNEADRKLLRDRGYTEEEINLGERVAWQAKSTRPAGKAHRMGELLEPIKDVPGAISIEQFKETVEKERTAKEKALKAEPGAKVLTGKTYAEAAKGDPKRNLFIQTTGKPGPVALVQVSTQATATTEEPEIATDYFNKLYQKREGYVRPADFWEVPHWINQAAGMMPDADVVVIRDPKVIAGEIKSQGYKAVLFSVMDVNKHVVKQVAEELGPDVTVIVGGYIDMAYFKGVENVKVHKTLEDAGKALGYEPTGKLDARHFKGTETIPRLCMSHGCLHKCAFCVVPKKVSAESPESIKKQLETFKGMDYTLVYMDDKTYGQAENFEDLKAVYKMIKESNPKFEGFIIQTTAPQLIKLDSALLQEAHIKFVELGVETYNDDLLAKIKKPARTKTIDQAVQKLRENKIAFIPNILVGLTGKGWTETKETYQNTLDFLDRNADIISHVNVYNLALYEGTDLANEIENRAEIDINENQVARSYHKDPKVHEDFYRNVLEFGSRQLDKEPRARTEKIYDRALKLKDGTVATGMTVLGRRSGLHAEVYDGLTPEQKNQVETEGFVTDKGRFVDRDQAAKMDTVPVPKVKKGKSPGKSPGKSAQVQMTLFNMREDIVAVPAEMKEAHMKALKEGFQKVRINLAKAINLQIVWSGKDLKELNHPLYMEMLSAKAFGRVAAVFDSLTNTCYVFGEANPSVIEAKRAAWHEFGHLSLWDLMGKDLDPLMDRVRSKYPDEIQNYLTKWDITDNTPNRRVAAEEVLIEKFTSNRDMTLVEKLRDLIQRFTRRIGFHDAITESDVKALLNAMRVNLIEDKKAEIATVFPTMQPEPGPKPPLARFLLVKYPDTWEKELIKAVQKSRDKLAKGEIDEGSPAYKKVYTNLGSYLQGRTIRHKPGTRFLVGAKSLYGSVKKDDKKVLVKAHGIYGDMEFETFEDKYGNRIIPGPILSEDPAERAKQIDEIAKKRKGEASWYEDWNSWMNQFVAAGMDQDTINKYIKIQAILSAGAGPKENQRQFARVINALEAGRLAPGKKAPAATSQFSLFKKAENQNEPEPAGTGISKNDYNKIVEIWEGRDNYNTLEERQAAYGMKVGAYMTAGLFPHTKGAVVIDRHMPRMWGYSVTWSPTMFEGGIAFDVHPEIQKEITRDIQASSERTGISPAGVQASLWFESRLPDLIAASYWEAAQEGREFVPEKMWDMTMAEGQNAIHYSEQTLDTIRGSKLAEDHHGYSRKDIGERKNRATAEWPYIPLGQFYGAGVQPEPVVRGKQPHLVTIPKGKVYDGKTDLLRLWRRATEITNRDPKAHLVNVFSKLVRNLKFQGFSYRDAKGNTLFAMFGETPVQKPVKIIANISEVVDKTNDLPQDLAELHETAKGRGPILFETIEKEFAARYPELKVRQDHLALAQFGVATSGKMEYSLDLQVEGPIDSIRAAFSDIIGLGKHQNMVLLRGSSEDTGNPNNGVTLQFKIKRGHTMVDIQEGLRRHKVNDYHLVPKEGMETVFDLFVEREPDPSVIAFYKEFGVKDSAIMYDESAEVLDKTNYKQHIVKHFGQKEGEKIYAAAQANGQVHALTGGKRSFDSELAIGEPGRERGSEAQGGKGIHIPVTEVPKVKILPIDEATAQKVVRRVTSVMENHPQFVLFETWQDVPEEWRKNWPIHKPEDAAGVMGFVHGKWAGRDAVIGIIRTKIKSEAKLVETIFHELIGHWGIRNVYKDKFEIEKFFTTVFEEHVMKDREFIDRLKKGYPYDITSSSDQARIAEEWFARAAERKENLRAAWFKEKFDHLAIMYQKFARSIGIKIPLSKAELREAIRESAASILKEGKTIMDLIGERPTKEMLEARVPKALRFKMADQAQQITDKFLASTDPEQRRIGKAMQGILAGKTHGFEPWELDMAYMALGPMVQQPEEEVGKADFLQSMAGIGPHTEPKHVELTLEEITAAMPYRFLRRGILYRNSVQYKRDFEAGLVGRQETKEEKAERHEWQEKEQAIIQRIREENPPPASDMEFFKKSREEQRRLMEEWKKERDRLIDVALSEARPAKQNARYLIMSKAMVEGARAEFKRLKEDWKEPMSPLATRVLQEKGQVYYETVGRIDALYEDQVKEMVAEFRADPEGSQSWSVVPRAQVVKVWKEYADNGYLSDRSAKIMDKIASRVAENIIKLQINKDLIGMGVAGWVFTDKILPVTFNMAPFSMDEREQYSFFITMELDDEVFGGAATRHSDFGISINDAVPILAAKTAEEQLLAVDLVFNQVHERFDMSAVFVEDGRATLDELAGKQDQLTELEKARLVIPESLKPESIENRKVGDYVRRYKGLGGDIRRQRQLAVEAQARDEVRDINTAEAQMRIRDAAQEVKAEAKKKAKEAEEKQINLFPSKEEKELEMLAKLLEPGKEKAQTWRAYSPDEVRQHIGLHEGSGKKQEPLGMSLWNKFVTNLFDVDLPRKILEQNTDPNLAAEVSGYKSAMMMSNIPAIMHSVFHEGRPVFEGNWIVTRPEAEGGLFTVYKNLGETAEDFFLWQTAKSALEMKNKGREHLFGKDQNTGDYLDDMEMIASIAKMTAPAYQANKAEWDAAEKRLREINTSILDFAEKAGIINGEQRQTWERENYIPFNRVMPEDPFTGDIDALFPVNPPAHVGTIFQLEGGKLNMGDPLMNLGNTYTYLIQQSLKNLTNVKTLALAQGAGLLEPSYPTPGKLKQGEISIRVDGKPKYFKVIDPWLYDALVEMDVMTGGQMDKLAKFILHTPKVALTWGVTIAPAFRLANFIRDTLTTAFMQKSFTGIIQATRGFVNSWRETPEFKEFASTGGAFTGAYHSRDIARRDFYGMEKVKRELQKWNDPASMLKRGIVYGLTLWDKIGAASENANRLRTYHQLRKQGKSAFEAAYESKDLLDFHRSGKNTALRYLTMMVPFLNARLQGLYKAGRAATDEKTRLNFWLHAMGIMIASMLLHMHNKDDDRYNSLTDADKLLYWHIFDVPGLGHVKIPVPFELGVIFVAVPTAIAERFEGTRTTRDLLRFMTRAAVNVLAMSPVPQAAAPLIDQWAGKSSFTGQPIIPSGEERLAPAEQYGPRTSKGARELGSLLGISPRRIDKLAQDYFGYLALFTSFFVDHALEAINDYPADPQDRIGDLMVSGAGRFIKGYSPKEYIKEQETFYDFLTDAETAFSTWKHYIRIKDKDEAKAWKASHRDLIATRKVLTSAQEQVNHVNQKIKIIYASEKMTADEKRNEIDRLLVKRGEIFKKAVRRYSNKMAEREKRNVD